MAVDIGVVAHLVIATVVTLVVAGPASEAWEVPQRIDDIVRGGVGNERSRGMAVRTASRR